MRTIYSILLCILCLFSSFTSANNTTPAYIPGDILVQIAADADIENIVQDFRLFSNVPTQLCAKKVLVPSLKIWQLQFDHTSIDQAKLLSAMFHHPKVKVVQNNHYTSYRATTPNDPGFAAQWQYINDGNSGGVEDADIDADDAWDITTGGITPLGDEIVVCVIDDGVDIDHEDWGDNLWVNNAEIPANGIDDDGNGYVDDYLGWNADNDTDDITDGGFGGGHGTPVAGIVGAQGDNEVGVAGVNWNVKVMVVVGGGAEADAIAAYAYPLEMRTRYNQSEGQQGAFVVATNASWGIDFGQPDDAPLWCAMYDELGVQGVLSAGATINGNQNVDVIGDLPTACPSDYLISVTNMNRSDIKVTGAGYGATTIDLGAFGQDTYTLAYGGYGGFGGTSGATPHVAGAIALLYAAPCPQLALLAKADPAAAATLVKSFILNGVDPNASLDGITTTGGRLNLFNSLNLAMAYDCAGTGCFAPFGVSVTDIIDVSATVNWMPVDAAIEYTLEYRLANDTGDWTTVTTTDTTSVIDGLMPCTEYVFHLASTCEDGESSFSFDYTFTTEGCCVPPPAVLVNNPSETTVEASWESIFAATNYSLQYRPLGTNDWITIDVFGSPFIITALEPCTAYEVQVGTNCTNGNLSGYSPITTFATWGCGFCVDGDYCASMGEDASYEAIGEVTIGDFTNISDDDGGYGDYTLLSVELEQGTTYPITLTPEYGNFGTYDEYFKIWIDYNQDGEFDEQAELAFDAGASTQTSISGYIVVPPDAMLGSTRMRVSMKWYEEGASEPCETFDYGEVEDYCVNVTEASTEEPCAPNTPVNLLVTDVTPNSATLLWDSDDACNSYTIRYQIVGSDDWQIISSSDAATQLNDLLEITEYMFEVRCNCTEASSDYSSTFVFNTTAVGIQSINNDTSLSMHPNPFGEALGITINTHLHQNVSVKLIDVTGKTVMSIARSIVPGTSTINFETVGIMGGVYFAHVTLENGEILTQKVIKL